MNQTMTPSSSAKKRFAETIALIDNGQYAEAETFCRELLDRYPRDVNIAGLLGAVLIKQNRLEAAEGVLRKTIALAPTFAKPHEDLGVALNEMGRFEEAVDELRTAVRLDPSLELAWFNLGRALARTGHGKEADEAFEKSFDLNPQRGKVARAAECHKAGRLDEAEALYREVVRDDPKNVDALRMLGRIALAAKRNVEAERLFRKAIAIAPDFIGALTDLGHALKELDRLEEAIACFRRVTELQPDNAHAHYLLATALAPAALTEEAIREHRKALDINPEHAGAMLGYGHTLKTVGRQEEAVSAYRECIRLKPHNGESYYSLANLKTYRLSGDDIREIEANLKRDDLTDQSRVNFLFALAKAFEDRGDYERAWHLYVEGNRLQRGLVGYDPVQTEFINDAIIRVFTKEFLDAHAGSGLPDPAPVFIVGLPRSGSTLIEQILASHSQVEGTAELPYLGRVSTSLNRNNPHGINYPEAVRELAAENFAALGRDYLDYAARHRVEGAPRFIDKMPNNFPTLGFLRLILPDATIIDARRHPLDACVSSFRQLFARGQTFTYDLTEIGEYYLQYERMIDHWNDVMPGKVLTVQYEALVSDFEHHVEKILEHCGLPFEDNCLRYFKTERPVRTASSEQVRQPIYRSSIGYFRHFEPWLDELKTVLEPSLPRYADYLPD